MNKIACIIILLVIVLSSSLGFAGKSYGTIYHAEYLYNYDGDTITVDIPGVQPILGERVGVRIRGIDTPEMRGHKDRGVEYHKKARLAKTLVEELCTGKTLMLRHVSRGKYFRIVADVYIEGGLFHKDIDLAKELLDAGLAITYDGTGSKF